MKTTINHLEISQIKKVLDSENCTYFGSGMAINLDANANALIQTLLVPNQPYILSENRILLVVEGQLDFRLNLVEYDIAKGDLALIPVNSIIEINAISGDFRCRMVTFDNHGKSLDALPDPIIAKGRTELAMHCDRIISILYDLSTSLAGHRESSAIFLAALVKYMEESEPYVPAMKHPLCRQDIILNDFLRLVHHNCTIHREIGWYADSLCISRHYLHQCVSSASGKTAGQWISFSLIQKARHLLKHTDLPIGDIALQLGFQSHSFFTKYFKNQTGISPGAYRYQV